MRLAAVAFTRQGCALGRTLAQGLEGCTLWATDRLAQSEGLPPSGPLSRWAAARFQDSQGLIFISACGIAVRAIAPWVKDKFSDPAVVAVDELGRFSVPLLSGHVGGGNDLARRVAALTGGTAVISTATDLNQVFAVDVWARKNQLALTDRALAKQISAALLEGKTVGFSSDLPIAGPCPVGLVDWAPLGICVTGNPQKAPFPQTLRLIPRQLVLGIGCKRGTTQQALDETVKRVLAKHKLSPEGVVSVASIDLKREEPGLLALCRAHGWPVQFYSTEELLAAQGEFTPSEFVRSVTGVDNVCERAATLSGELIVKKQAENGITVAVARTALLLRFEDLR